MILAFVAYIKEQGFFPNFLPSGKFSYYWTIWVALGSSHPSCTKFQAINVTVIGISNHFGELGTYVYVVYVSSISRSRWLCQHIHTLSESVACFLPLVAFFAFNVYFAILFCSFLCQKQVDILPSKLCSGGITILELPLATWKSATLPFMPIFMQLHQ